MTPEHINDLNHLRTLAAGLEDLARKGPVEELLGAVRALGAEEYAEGEERYILERAPNSDDSEDLLREAAERALRVAVSRALIKQKDQAPDEEPETLALATCLLEPFRGAAEDSPFAVHAALYETLNTAIGAALEARAKAHGSTKLRYIGPERKIGVAGFNKPGSKYLEPRKVLELDKATAARCLDKYPDLFETVD